VRLPSLISRFERNTKSGDPFGVAEMVQPGGSESIRDDAFPIATSIAIVGRVKRLLKIADQMQPELERDRPFAGMVARVGKLDVDAVPLGVLPLSLPRAVRGPNPDTDPPRSRRSRCHVAVDPIVRGPIEQTHPS